MHHQGTAKAIFPQILKKRMLIAVTWFTNSNLYVASKWKSESLYASDNWSESVVCCSFPLSPPRLVIYERRRDLILATTSSVNKGLVFILSPYSSRPFITRVILLLASSLTDPHIFVSKKNNIFVLKKTYSRPLEKKSHGWNFFCDSLDSCHLIEALEVISGPIFFEMNPVGPSCWYIKVANSHGC